MSKEVLNSFPPLRGLFDTHAHPTDNRFDDDREALLAAMLEDGAVTGGIVPRLHEDAFAEMGFSTAPHRKNFLEVYYEKH